MSTKPLVPVAPEEMPVGDESIPATPRKKASVYEIVAWAMVGGLILFVLTEHLVPAAIVGLTLYRILDRVTHWFSSRLSRTTVRPLALIIVTLLTAALITIALGLAAGVLRSGTTNVADMMNQMAEILDSTRAWLGGFGESVIPEVLTDANDFKATVVQWLKDNAKALRAGGLWLGIGLFYMVMGGLLAILVFFRQVTKHDEERRGPLARKLLEKVDRFSDAFAQVAVAQIKISAVNTTLTGLYLLVVLPAFGIRIPFASTLVLITFLCGLIPVLGNLISNTVITILSMGISLGTAIASLTFLILIHKLEYLINSRIVGGETDSQAWEILLAIIIGEAAFGVGGIVMAPIIYAFVKGELRERRLV